MLEQAGVTFTLGTVMTDVVMDRAAIAGCVLAGKSGMFAVKARVYIDCTGDGDLACWDHQHLGPVLEGPYKPFSCGH
jgi:flavin-dependent dehydrogenase